MYGLNYIFCLTVLVVASMVRGSSRSDFSSEMLRRSDEAGRLRRGFHASSLATARGFGKRFNPIPFVSGQLEGEDGANKKVQNSAVKESLNHSRRYQIPTVVNLIRKDPILMAILGQRIVDSDLDGWSPETLSQFPDK